MKEKLLEARFCNEDTYMSKDGREIIGVCRTLTAEEVLTFMHQYDAGVTEELITNHDIHTS